MSRLLLALVALTLLGCAAPGHHHDHDDGRPLVLVTVPPQAHVVERVAGDTVRVEALLSGGSDPHHHEPGFDELHAVNEAALWVKVGHPDFSFERAWVDRLVADAPELVVVDGSGGLKLLPGDAHVWLSPANAVELAESVAEALAEMLPEEAETFRANARAFEEQTLALDAELSATLAPAKGKWFLVVHPAWGYVAERYGLEQVAIERDGREPDPKTLAEIVERAREANLEVIFVEPQFHAAAAEAVAEEIGARLVVIDPLARDWDANLRRVAAELAAGSAS